MVDDDTGIRHLGTEVLIRHGYQVDAAEDHTAGWKALQSHTYDLLITDLYAGVVRLEAGEEAA